MPEIKGTQKAIPSECCKTRPKLILSESLFDSLQERNSGW